MKVVHLMNVLKSLDENAEVVTYNYIKDEKGNIVEIKVF